LIFFKAQAREEDWQELQPDKNAEYDRIIELDLSDIVPNIACPHSPDNVRTVKEVAGLVLKAGAVRKTVKYI